MTVLLCAGTPSDGRTETILFESAVLGATGLSQGSVAATNVTASVFTGVRFEITQPVVTSEIGGHFVSASGGDFFGAIVRLVDENDFPDSADLSSSDVIGHATLTFPVASGEVFGELDLPLEPGWYALVVGSGLFATTGDGAAPLNSPDIDGASYLGYQSGFGWGNRLPGRRYVVKGTIVPEPSTFLLAILQAVFVCYSVRNCARSDRVDANKPRQFSQYQFCQSLRR